MNHDAANQEAAAQDRTEAAGQAGPAGTGGADGVPAGSAGPVEGGEAARSDAPTGLNVKPINAGQAEAVARRFHEAYEALAPQFGYTTREASAKPWEDVPENNRQLMTGTVFRLMDHADILAFDPGELAALADATSDIALRVYDGDTSMGPELASAVKKLHFAFGRCHGMTDYDMQIREDDDGGS